MDTTKKFSGKAQIYEKYRPGYTKECIQYILGTLDNTKHNKIADIGAGTGIFSKHLLEQGQQVIAVEPNDDMRLEAEKKLKQYPLFLAVKASAEDTGLEEHSIDLLTVAQAFHWFDVLKFQKECSRILKPDGKVFLIWNSRDPESDLVKKNAEVCAAFCPDFTGFSGGERGTKEETFRTFFRDGKYEMKKFANDLYFDKKGFIGRNLSASYALKEGDENYEAFIIALEALFNKYQEDNKILLANTIQCYSGTV